MALARPGPAPSGGVGSERVLSCGGASCSSASATRSRPAAGILRRFTAAVPLSLRSRCPPRLGSVQRQLPPAQPRRRALAVRGYTTPGGGRGSTAQDEEFVDTRIHWDDPDAGWIQGDSPRGKVPRDVDAGPSLWPISRDLVMAIMEVEGTHYSILGVTPTADMNSVKGAYRRLSKLYHPDTTELPLELAEQKFVQLREAYSVLSNEEQRRLYDWKIASESSKRKGSRFVWPYEVDASQRGPGSRNPAPLDPKKRVQYGTQMDEDGNVPISDGSMAALSFDLFALLFAVSCMVYAAYFKS